MKHKRALDAIPGGVQSALIFSPPDMCEGEDSIYAESDDLIKRFWKQMMDEHGTAQKIPGKPRRTLQKAGPAGDHEWGSCTAKGKLILNTELIRAPRGCIEYVIVHELCHLAHHNHGKAFQALQAREYPAWVKWKRVLEERMV
ncbi:M48 family metallopeptidase [Lewinella sp. 4G2]|uniref:M48 metallopeptidase family protein n=1 Tax=Lewinella sp. 4G2 TaxID=1803372 RepID=UPI001E376E01|nr:M48 family metallopeptidase [Lewinella sp. 4G2]